MDSSSDRDLERAALEGSLPLSEPGDPEKELFITQYQPPARLLLFGVLCSFKISSP